MTDALDDILSQAKAAFLTSNDEPALREARARFLGRRGVIGAAMKDLAGLESEERAKRGNRLNSLKKAIEEAATAREREILSAHRRSEAEERAVDITLPGRRVGIGAMHPVTIVFEEIVGIMKGLGFEVADGPEVETDYHNFEALNIPRDHPARDMQDTFYISPEVVLRTHTSPVQIRWMKTHSPPVRIIAPGRVFRHDDPAPARSPMFHQVEALLVDADVTFAHLKGVLEHLATCLFGDIGTRLRFRPSFFPFTEPSAEVDIKCVICRGSGCRVCKHTGWLEILGSGMVHPKVFENVGYDPSRVTGFAFGLGIDRIAMLKYGIDDIRVFYENDMRFLRQFS